MYSPKANYLANIRSMVIVCALLLLIACTMAANPLPLRAAFSDNAPASQPTALFR